MLSSRFIRTSGSRLAQARPFHQQSTVSEGFLGKLFGSKKADTPQTTEGQSPAVGDIIQDSNAQQRKLGGKKNNASYELIQPKFPKREYSAARLECRIKQVLKSCEVPLDTADWKSTQLVEKDVKFKVLSGVMKYVKLQVTNRALNNVRTVGDLLEELSLKPVSKDAGHPVAQFYAEKSEELPPNMKFEPFTKTSRKLHVHQ
ncbi:hypothetical protein LPJ66_001482 [Kickxella alabastrina]|uniref:Uncharacterized protein n=1 Tax=Kickxella alabastrina TaxID=61397 RepID=A0ACC1IT96_9FUNG|nr:hypothetical protein LPJ66_001482 [Kickxella alabastrina]